MGYQVVGSKNQLNKHQRTEARANGNWSTSKRKSKLKKG